MNDLDKYLPFADQPTPKAQEGTWTLIAPDGRTFTGPSPLACAGAENKTRVPPHVALGRIARGMQEPLAEAPRSDEKESAQEKSVQPADERIWDLLAKLEVYKIDGAYQFGVFGYPGLFGSGDAAIRAAIAPTKEQTNDTE